MRDIVRIGALVWLLLVLPVSGHERGREAAPEDRHELSLVTLNLYHDKAQWPMRLPLIVAELRNLQPDVVALQEVLQHETLPNQARTLAEALGYRYAFVSTDPPDRARRYGNAVLTRHPILALDWKPLEPLDDSRTALHLRIAVDGRPLDIYNTHLHWTDAGGAIRRRQIVDLIDFIANTRGAAPSVVMGDFNAESTAPELQGLANDYIEVYAALRPRQAGRDASTLNPAYFDEPRHIDQVFMQRGAFEPVQARIILDEASAEGIWPSDHFGVHASLRWLPSQE